MKNKAIFSVIVLLSISFLAISANVFGQTTYLIQFNEGEEYIFTITKISPPFDVYYELGDKMKINITDITDQGDYFYVEFDEWDSISKNEEFSIIPDDDSWEEVYKDPTDPDAVWELYYFVLTPVSDYLEEFAEANSEYSSSGNKLTQSIGNSTYIYTFDSNGVLSKNEVKQSGTTVAVLSRGGGGGLSIPGYDLPILIGLTAIVGISIIYCMKNKLLK